MIALKSRYLLLAALPLLMAFYRSPASEQTPLATQPNKHITVSTTFCENGAIPECVPAHLRIWDGDTFIIDRLDAKPLKIRIENIDAPEIHGQCQSEIDGAQVAKRRLAALTENHNMRIIPSHLDRYQRQLATVLADGVDVGEVMIAEGIVRRWDGRRRPWC